jgi:hypothetical protein
VVLGSSDAPIDPAAAWELGQRLTGTEAGLVADRLADGDTLTSALRAVAAGNRATVRTLLAAGSSPASRIAVLRAIEGARSAPTSATPLWTMPGHLARSGPLTASVPHLVDRARQSITCSTFNFQRSSGLWQALRRAAGRPELAVRVYLDAAAAGRGSPTTSPCTCGQPSSCARRSSMVRACATTRSSSRSTTDSCW